MTRKQLASFGAALAVALIAVAVLAWPASGGSVRTIHFFEAGSGGYGAEIDATRDKRRVGDYVVFHSKVFDRKGGLVIRQIDAFCVHGHFRDLCQGYLGFNGRGTITFYGLGSLTDKPHIDRFAITGGTAEFVGTGGEMWFDSRTATDAGIDWTATLVR